MSRSILRQWAILSLLPKPPRRIDSASIEGELRARGFATHRRTIQRDLLQLAEVFPIAADERHKPYGWRWLEDARLPRFVAAGSDRVLTARLRVAAASLPSVLEAFRGLAPRVERSGEDAVVVCAIADDATSRRLVMGLEVEVLEPASLRGEIAARVARLARLYGVVTAR
ncbi:MAG: hypothetical protein KF819_16005 [Labilithrix sp.]|nr:hypothetical protein [Labilithrix sp.]